ncbi:MAG: aldose 1-epimerase family protein [Saprospiraceae bacterium]|nr:aldose 1-epimerase family protein [Saprospiraceae bacterium]
MSIVGLENEFLKVGVKLKGAELCSVIDKKTEVEHIWRADPEVWGRHAPILFPLVGQVEGGEYRAEGNEYKLGQHGFARDNEFELVESTDSSLLFQLRSSQATKELYPYDFILSVSYSLEGNALSISYQVENTDSRDIYFNLGGHPGFSVPFTPETEFTDYALKFNEPEILDRILLTEQGLVSGEKIIGYLNNEKEIPLTYELFDQDALVFEGIKSETLSIISEKSDMELEFSLGNYPFLGIWSKPGARAPFVCIEPWYGHTAVEGNSKELKDRVNISQLLSGEKLSDTFKIRIKKA